MKKFLFFLFVTLPLVFIACTDDKKSSETTVSADTTHMAGDTTKEVKETLKAKKLLAIDVARLQANYVRFLGTGEIKPIQIINYSTPCLQKYIKTGDGGLFIMGAEDDKKVVIILDVYDQTSQTSSITTSMK